MLVFKLVGSRFIPRAWYHSSVDGSFTLPGDILIHYSSLLLGLGTFIGLGLIARNSPPSRTDEQLNAALVALFGALLAGRLVYALILWPYFRTHLAELALLNLGGISPGGALLGALAALWLWSRYRELSFASLADAMLPLAGSLTISGWLACWVDGSAYGLDSSAWWALPAPDESGWLSPRLPVQFIAMLSAALWLWTLYRPLAARLRPGQAAALFLAGICLVHFALTYLRADPIPVWLGLRWDAWSALAISLLALAAFRLVRRHAL